MYNCKVYEQDISYIEHISNVDLIVANSNSSLDFGEPVFWKYGVFSLPATFFSVFRSSTFVLASFFCPSFFAFFYFCPLFFVSLYSLILSFLFCSLILLSSLFCCLLFLSFCLLSFIFSFLFIPFCFCPF